MTAFQIIPIIVSMLSLGLSLYTYCKHDAKIKKQNTLINQFQLEKLRKETDSEKKAIIEANVVKREKGKRIVKVYNKGKAIAKNVVVTFPGAPNVSIMDYPASIDIRAQNSIDIQINASKISPETLKINFEWEDDLSLNNKDSQIIQV
ncbi:hypothetical protein [Cyclobacterium qasimii]|uniref:Uncharacterized protein n=1 Tax=Cyclobacterium qasimii TaxID=1350429 RepID=A0A512CII6_9BACT|nr:hypothetical protein [Cyclobacterium qasimii]GEO24034.1 hypothetical protein CQA01_45680 [Cyclobacterium qasimii]